MIPVSIIIPIYNVEPYIVDCLQSVMRQTYQGPIECIMVDDCGSDKSIEVAESLVAEYNGPISFKTLHHECNRGLSAARNTGMDAAKGDYLYFLDSDDWISGDCIKLLADSIQKEMVDIVVGDYEMVGGMPSKWIKLSHPEGKYHEKEFAKTFCNAGVYVMAVNKLYRKEFLLKNQLRFEEGKVHEDEIFAFELSCVEKSFCVVKSVTYFYRIRENSIMTGSEPMKKINGYVGVLQSVKKKVGRYSKVDGIYDFYLWEIKRIFGWIDNKMDDSISGNYIDRQVEGYLDVVPSVLCLRSKYNRLFYITCKKKQTYSRYQYIASVYAHKIIGRLLQKMLGLLPYKKLL